MKAVVLVAYLMLMPSQVQPVTKALGYNNAVTAVQLYEVSKHNTMKECQEAMNKKNVQKGHVFLSCTEN